MEKLLVGWLTEFEKEEEDPVLIHGMDLLDDLTPQKLAALFQVDFQNSEGLSSYPTFGTSSDTNMVNSSFVQKDSQTCEERPASQLKSNTTDSWNSSTTEQISSPEASSFPTVFRFGNSVGSAKSKVEAVPSEKKCVTPDSRISQVNYEDANCVPKPGSERKRASNPRACTQDHVIAERKRREKLTQQFIALSAIVPGLKRMDKVSVLEDCMKYIKHLQEKVKTLEEQTTKTTMESAVLVKKFRISSDSDYSSTDEISSQEPLPEVEAKISGRNVLIRIHCEKHKGIMAQMLLEIEKLNLIVISSNAMPFGSSTLDIILLTEMDAEFNMTVTDLVKKFRASVVQFMVKDLALD